MRKVIHLIPYDGIGGVERAAASMRNVSTEHFDFHVETIFPPSAATSRWLKWNPWQFLRSVAHLWRTKPSVLIVSLWRAYAVGIAVKLIRPKTRLVVFLHLPHDVHGPDRFLTRLAASLACQVWADSHETLGRRLPKIKPENSQVISFVTARIGSLPTIPVRPSFVFWGRIHPQKGLGRALQIFAAIKATYADARFWIIGPDGGDLGRVKGIVNDLNLGAAVQFLGSQDFSGIESVARNASFYLQTSEMEGMAMSVVESMQLGLVPVVTPVGEIKSYAHHGKNAVIVEDDVSTVADVLSLLNDNERYQVMRAQTLGTWQNAPLYRDSLLSACRNIMKYAD